MQDKENNPFLIARRPAKPRGNRLDFGDENWRSVQLRPGQDCDDEVYSLCQKFATTSVR